MQYFNFKSYKYLRRLTQLICIISKLRAIFENQEGKILDVKNFVYF